jgi:hypothetical protein
VFLRLFLNFTALAVRDLTEAWRSCAIFSTTRCLSSRGHNPAGGLD